MNVESGNKMTINKGINPLEGSHGRAFNEVYLNVKYKMQKKNYWIY